MKAITVRLDEALLERVDVARGDVPRERWLRRAVELALGGVESVAGVEPRAPSGMPLPDEKPAGSPAPKISRSGCLEHPGAGAVSSRGQWWCAKPGCTRPGGVR